MLHDSRTGKPPRRHNRYNRYNRHNRHNRHNQKSVPPTFRGATNVGKSVPPPFWLSFSGAALLGATHPAVPFWVPPTQLSCSHVTSQRGFIGTGAKFTKDVTIAFLRLLAPFSSLLTSRWQRDGTMVAGTLMGTPHAGLAEFPADIPEKAPHKSVPPTAQIGAAQIGAAQIGAAQIGATHRTNRCHPPCELVDIRVPRGCRVPPGCHPFCRSFSVRLIEAN